MPAPSTTIVVGAGIVGASIAWHLAKAGAAVTIVEAGQAGGIATARSFAWINASWGNPEPYFRLRRRSMAEWARLAAELPEIRLDWAGGLCWDLSADGMEAYAAEHGSWGYGIRKVGRDEAKRIEPNLADPPDMALHVAEEGMVEPAAAARALVADAVRRGAGLVEGREVRSLIVEGGAVRGVETDGGELRADETVIAAGVATPRLAASAGIEVPLAGSPGLMVFSHPTERLLNGVVIAERLELRQAADGRLVAATAVGSGAPGQDAETAARAAFGEVQAMLVGGERLALDRHAVGYRPMPVDGFPIVGRTGGAEGLYVAVTHSGITLAPAVGLFAAAELLGGQEEPLLAPYRPNRFG